MIVMLFILGNHCFAAGANEISKQSSKDALVVEAKSLIGKFADSLKAELGHAIQTGGLKQGIVACQVKAPEVTHSLSQDGWHVARTSLKLRNPKNAPDEWEREMLLQFEKRLASGEAFDKLVAVQHSDTQFKLIKAIPTGALCLSCHGEQLPPEVGEALREHYPDDKATGFEVGEIRGAFVVSKQLLNDI